MAATSNLTLIVAATVSNGIGVNGTLPWRLAKEMAYFVQATSHVPSEIQDKDANAVIMGRNTWESIPPKYRPLKNRVNYVVSRNKDYDLKSPQAVLSNSLQQALDTSLADQRVHRRFLIGGATLYKEALSLADRILLTRILSPAFNECDTFMPDFLSDGTRWRRARAEEFDAWVGFQVAKDVQEEKGVQYEFQMWVRE